MDKPNYGPPMQSLPYDAMWKGPMEVSRKKTDFRAFKFYLSCLIIWLGIGISSFVCVTFLKPKKDTVDDEFIQKIEHRTFNWSLIANITDTENYEVFTYLFTHFPLRMFQILSQDPATFLTTIGCAILTSVLSLLFIWFFGRCAKVALGIVLGIFCLVLLGVIVTSFLDGGAMIVLGIIYSVVFTAIVMIIVKFKEKIKISCELIRVAGSSAFFTPYHILMPFVQFILSFVSLLFFANNIRLLSVIGKNIEHSDRDALSFFLILLHLGNLVGWLWTLNFIYGMVDMILSGSYGTWYWTLNKQQVPKNTVQYFTSTVSKYHLGTLAAGSIFMSLCEIVDVCLSIIYQVTCRSEDLTCILSSLSNFGNYFLKVVESAARDAYVLCALHGTDFITSGKNAYHLIKNNFGTFVLTYLSFSIITILATLAVLVPMLLAYSIPKDLKIDELFSITVTFIFVGMLANAFFHLLQSGVDTIFISAMEDIKRNDNSVERPYYMNVELQELMTQK